MKIRFATLDDIGACIELGQRLHQLTRFARYPYEPARVEQQLRQLIGIGQHARRSHCLLLAEADDAQLAGGLIACIESHLFSSLPVASLIVYGVLPERRMSGAALRLMRAFVRWARQRGAVEVNAGINSALDTARSERFLQKIGFVRTGGNYAICLSPR